MTLRQSGARVTGNLVTTDGSRGLVTGTIQGAVLTLTRVTGRDTTQHYRVEVRGDAFTGKFRNEGRYPDSGTFTGRRRSTTVAGTTTTGGTKTAAGTKTAPGSTTVAGTWTVVFNGRTSTTMKLEQSGDSVTGNLVTTDRSRGYVTGRLSGAVLTLTRVTGLDTTQHYRVTVQGDRFTGTFHNEGRYTDNGSFSGSRH